MLVEHLVNKRVPRVHPDDDVLSAARQLLECRSAVLPVVEEDERGARLVGVLCHRDAFTATYGHTDRLATMPVAAAMSPAACTCRASDSLGLAVRLLRRSGSDALPVLDRDGYLVGVLSFADLVRQVAG
jgi:CBS-domain-containing membrane protein